MHETIRKYLKENSPLGEAPDFTNDESLLESGIIDSMSMVGLIAFLEEKYAMTIDDDDMTPENFESVDSIAAFIQSKQ